MPQGVKFGGESSWTPAGGLVDRLKPRLALGCGLIFWSVAQLFGGLVGSFWQFVGARVVLGLGESPQCVTGSRVARDWFHAKDRGLATGVFISASALGTATSAPMLTFPMLAFGWRWMFAIMGIAGLVLGAIWLAFYRDPEKAGLTAKESAYLVAGDVCSSPTPAGGLAEWGRMFRFRTTWGVVAGHFGEVYMIWLYTAWAAFIESNVAAVGAVLFFGLITVPLNDADLAEATA